MFIVYLLCVTVINTSSSKKSKMLLLSPRSLRHERLFSVPCGKVNGADMYRMNRVKVRSGRLPREGFLRITEYYRAKQEVGRCSNLGYTLESLW